MHQLTVMQGVGEQNAELGVKCSQRPQRSSFMVLKQKMDVMFAFINTDIYIITKT